MSFRNKSFQNFSLFITGCGFVLIMFLTYFIITYDDKNNTSLEELKRSHKTIDDNFVYKFMNSAIFESDSLMTDSLNYTKLLYVSLRHKTHTRTYLLSFLDREVKLKDLDFMLNQFNNEFYIWDEKNLVNCWTVLPSEINAIHKNDSVDFWEAFQNKYGFNGKHSYSIPIYNRAKTFVIVEHNMQGHWLWGVHELLAFKKVDGVWKIFDRKILSMS